MTKKDKEKKSATEPKTSVHFLLEELKDFRKSIQRELNDIIGRMATKGDLARLEMSLLEEMNSLRNEMATESNVEGTKEEITSVLHPMQRAQEKDALTVVTHENRIARLEEKAGLIVKK